MVSYYNPMAMYSQHQGPVGPSSGQFNSGSPTGGWYGGYHQSGHMPTPQQYLSCMQDSEPKQVPWHHPHPGHSVFNHEYFDYNTYIQQHNQQQLHQNRPDSESQLPSPPMSSSELSSPGAPAGGSVTPPNHQPTRPGSIRSPYNWMTKPSYQSQPNPGKTRTKDKYRVVYTDHQRLELEKEFHFSRYITIRRKSELAANLGLSERQVKIWFQNRRAKERKQAKKRDELSHKEQLNSSNVATALSLHSQSLLHHHQVSVQQQQQQQHQQAAAAAAAVSVAVASAHQQHQTQLGAGGGPGGHVTVVPVPVPLM